MSHSHLLPHSITKSLGASNVSPLQPSGSTTMTLAASAYRRRWKDGHRVPQSYQMLQPYPLMGLLMLNEMKVLWSKESEL